jgi:PAS domain-containing protein
MPPESSPTDISTFDVLADATAPPALIAAALAQLTEGVTVTDAGGRIRFINAAAERLHGVTRLGVGVEEYASAYRLYTEDGRPYMSAELPLARAVLCGETVIDEHPTVQGPERPALLRGARRV